VHSTNQQLASHIDESTDQIRANVSEALYLMDQQNTTMILWDRIDEMSEQINKTRKYNDNITEITQNIKHTSES